MGVSTWLAIVGVSWAVLCAIIAWIFATGRWTQRHEQAHKDHEKKFKDCHHEIEKLKRDIESLRNFMTADDVQRRAVVDRLNVSIGRVSSRVNVLYREIALRVEHGSRELMDLKTQLDRAEDYARSLQRQIDQHR